MYRFELGSTRVECDTFEELQSALGKPAKTASATAVATAPAKTKTGKPDGRGKAAKALWAKARKLAKEKGIPVKEARSLIAKQRA